MGKDLAMAERDLFSITLGRDTFSALPAIIALPPRAHRISRRTETTISALMARLVLPRPMLLAMPDIEMLIGMSDVVKR
jgi:hypothetical protein